MIINNQVFYKGNKHVDTRDGSDVDCDNLVRLFEDLAFEITNDGEPFENLTEQVS